MLISTASELSNSIPADLALKKEQCERISAKRVPSVNLSSAEQDNEQMKFLQFGTKAILALLQMLHIHFCSILIWHRR